MLTETHTQRNSLKLMSMGRNDNMKARCNSGQIPITKIEPKMKESTKDFLDYSLSVHSKNLENMNYGQPNRMANVR